MKITQYGDMKNFLNNKLKIDKRLFFCFQFKLVFASMKYTWLSLVFTLELAFIAQQYPYGSLFQLGQSWVRF